MKLTLICLILFSSEAFAKRKVVVDSAARENLIELKARQIELENEVRRQERVIRKAESSAMKKARKSVEKDEKKAVNALQEERELYERAEIRGCPAGSVKVYPKAAENPALWIYAKIPVTNPYDYPVLIKYGGEIVVENLCPNGSMTLTKVLETWNHGITPLRYTAEGRDKTGKVGISTYYGIDLYPCQGLPCQIFRPQTDWRIQLY